MSVAAIIDAAVTRNDLRISIVDGVRRAFAHFKDHKTFTMRAVRVIEKELPAFTVAYSSEHGSNEVRIWGVDLAYNDCVRISWTTPDATSTTPWAERFERGMKIADYRDYEERAMDERALFDTFDRMAKQIVDLRAAAAAKIAALAVPASATIRGEPWRWETASSELRKRYPLLFGEVRS